MLDRIPSFVYVCVVIAIQLCAIQCYVEIDFVNRKATYLEAKVGSYVVFNCPLEFPHEIEIPFAVHWNKDSSSMNKVIDHISIV